MRVVGRSSSRDFIAGEESSVECISAQYRFAVCNYITELHFPCMGLLRLAIYCNIVMLERTATRLYM